MSIAHSSLVSAVAWGSRTAVQAHATELFLRLATGGAAVNVLTPAGAALSLGANYLAALTTTQYVGVQHAFVDNLGNAAKRAVNWASTQCGGDALLGGAPTNTQFLADQKRGVPVGWGGQAAIRAAVAQFTPQHAPSVEDVFAPNPEAQVALTGSVGLFVQGIPYFYAMFRQQEMQVPPVPKPALMDNIWERTHATFAAESKGVPSLAAWQAVLSTSLRALSQGAAPAWGKAVVAFLVTAGLHTSRIAAFMAEKKAHETMADPSEDSQGRLSQVMQAMAFAVMVVAWFDSVASLPLHPSDALPTWGIDAATSVAIGLISGAGAGAAGEYAAARAGDTKRAAVIGNAFTSAAAVLASYGGGVGAGMVAAGVAPLYRMLRTAYAQLRAEPPPPSSEELTAAQLARHQVELAAVPAAAERLEESDSSSSPGQEAAALPTAASLESPEAQAEFGFLKTVQPGEMLTLAGVDTPLQFLCMVADEVHGVLVEVKSSGGLLDPEHLQILAAHGSPVGRDEVDGGTIYRFPVATARFERSASPSQPESKYP